MNHLVALIAGYPLDLLFGDPLRLPHPVVAIGKTIAGLEKALRRIFPETPRCECLAGAILTLFVVSLAFAATSAAVALAGRAHPCAALAVEILVCYQVLATKCLRDAGMDVYRELSRGDLAGARRMVARIVGRDAGALDESAIARATVETVAENASDGVVAPMLYFALGGAPLAMAYKAINTMDSMLGYKNEKYLFFGRAAAHLDDLANYVPARLTALLMIAAAGLCGLDWRGAARVWRRDRRNHSSPNSGHPESACAGALGLRLGGDSVYGGRLVRKPVIGDAAREIEPEDIGRAGRLLYVAASLCFALCCAGMYAAWRFSGQAPAWN